VAGEGGHAGTVTDTLTSAGLAMTSLPVTAEHSPGGTYADCLVALRAPPERLKRRPQFLRVAAKGRKAVMPGLVLQVLPRADHGAARVGFTVTKKVGNAVIRNRARRRLKEAARLHLAEHPLHGVDLVLIGRDATGTRDFKDLRQDLHRALAKAGVR